MGLFSTKSKKEEKLFDKLKNNIQGIKCYEAIPGVNMISNGLIIQDKEAFLNAIVDTKGKLVFYFPTYSTPYDYIVTSINFGEAIDDIENRVPLEIKEKLFELAKKEIMEFNQSIEKLDFSIPETIYYYFPYQNTMIVFIEKTELGEMLESMEAEEKAEQIALDHESELYELIETEKSNKINLDELKKKLGETIIADKEIMEYPYYCCNADKLKGRDIFNQHVIEKYFSPNTNNQFAPLVQEYSESKNRYPFSQYTYPLFDNIWWNFVIPKRDEMNKNIRSELRQKLIPFIKNDDKFKKCTNEKLRRDYIKNLFDTLDSSYDYLTMDYKNTGKIKSDDLVLANKIWNEIKN